MTETRTPEEIINSYHQIKNCRSYISRMNHQSPIRDNPEVIDVPLSLSTLTDEELADVFTQQTEVLRSMYIDVGEAEAASSHLGHIYDVELNKEIIVRGIKEKRKELDEVAALTLDSNLAQMFSDLQVLKTYFKLISSYCEGQKRLVDRLSREQTRRDKMNQLDTQGR